MFTLVASCVCMISKQRAHLASLTSALVSFLVGKMIMEMGDQSTIKCKSLDLICELEFKTKVSFFHLANLFQCVSMCISKKGYFSGQYHSVTGKIKRISTGDVLYEISGVWTEELFIKGKVIEGSESVECDH